MADQQWDVRAVPLIIGHNREHGRRGIGRPGGDEDVKIAKQPQPKSKKRRSCTGNWMTCASPRPVLYCDFVELKFLSGTTITVRDDSCRAKTPSGLLSPIGLTSCAGDRRAHRASNRTDAFAKRHERRRNVCILQSASEYLRKRACSERQSNEVPLVVRAGKIGRFGPGRTHRPTHVLVGVVMPSAARGGLR